MNNMMDKDDRPVSRAISAMIVLIYLSVSVLSGGLEGLLGTVAFCVIPLACI